MKYLRFLFAALLVLTFFGGVGAFLHQGSISSVALAAEDAGGSDPTGNGDDTGSGDCPGGQCGAEITVDDCSVSGTQCYSAQFCTEYNTPIFSSPLEVSATAGQSFSYEVKVRQVNPNPSRSLAPWEHPLIQERAGDEAGWYGVNVTSADNGGLAGSGLSANPSSVRVQKRAGVVQVPDSTGLMISGVPSAPGEYLVPLTTRNDLEDWQYQGGENQSSTGTGVGGFYVARSASCSSADVLKVTVAPASCPTAPPEITSADTNGQVGEEFHFQAQARNYTEISMTAEQLPDGTSWTSPLSVGGTPRVSGIYRFSIHARNVTPGCNPMSASKDISVNIAPAGQCATSTPMITSAGSVAAIIGQAFPGYTIQTSRPAAQYSLTPSGGDDSFPASLGITNGGRSLEGTVASTQPQQQYHFLARAAKADGSCPSVREVTIGLSCPSERPNWNPSSGQCTDRCTDQGALNYNQVGQCTYPSARCNDPLALNGGEAGACRYSGGRSLCTDPTAINFGLTGSCQPRTSCGAGESGVYPNCREIPCPTCGQTKMCNVCVETNENGSCARHEMQPASEMQSAANSCGLTRSLYYCPDENSPTPPPPPGEQACALAATTFMPDRELIQKGSQCTIPWRVSSVPTEQSQFLRCVISGPDFSVRANGSSGQVQTPPVSVQSLYKLVCRNGDAKVSNTSSFTCRVSPRFEER